MSATRRRAISPVSAKKYDPVTLQSRLLYPRYTARAMSDTVALASYGDARRRAKLTRARSNIWTISTWPA